MEKENIDYVVCKICGAKRRVLTQHLKIKHNLSRKEYEEMYNSKAVCQSRTNLQIERNKELNHMLSTDENYIKLMKEVRHRNALLPQVVEAKLVKWDEYLHSDLNRERSRQRMLNPEFQKLCTEGKLKSEKFKKQKSEYLTNYLIEKHKDKEWEANLISKAFDGSLKEYVDSQNNKVKFRSTWELQIHNYLTEHNIEYEYEKLKIKYIYDNKEHTYYPDFYISSMNLVLEVKPKMYTTNKKNQIKMQSAILAGYNFKFVTETELKDLNSFFHNL